jgi:glycosyltransferase involved in cell wall biosynthesis
MEAMASGSLLVVDKRGGWNVLVDDGVNGWLCMDQREFIYKASRCAFEHEETQMMRIRAREKLEQNWGLTASAETWKKVFQQMAALRR